MPEAERNYLLYTLHQMPWLLSALDAAAHLLVYALFVPKTLLVDLLAGYRYHFRFRSSMEDVLLVALVRAVAVGSASCSGVDRFQR